MKDTWLIALFSILVLVPLAGKLMAEIFIWLSQKIHSLKADNLKSNNGRRAAT